MHVNETYETFIQLILGYNGGQKAKTLKFKQTNKCLCVCEIKIRLICWFLSVFQEGSEGGKKV